VAGANPAYFTRVNVVVLQKMAATHPESSTAFRPLTISVPEYDLPSARL
jgi:hypothetical protein